MNEWAGVCEPRLVLRHAWPERIAPQVTPPQTRPREPELAPAAGRRGEGEGAEHEQELVLFSLP